MFGPNHNQNPQGNILFSANTTPKTDGSGTQEYYATDSSTDLDEDEIDQNENPVNHWAQIPLQNFEHQQKATQGNKRRIDEDEDTNHYYDDQKYFTPLPDPTKGQRTETTRYYKNDVGDNSSNPYEKKQKPSEYEDVADDLNRIELSEGETKNNNNNNNQGKFIPQEQPKPKEMYMYNDYSKNQEKLGLPQQTMLTRCNAINPNDDYSFKHFPERIEDSISAYLESTTISKTNDKDSEILGENTKSSDEN